MRANWYVYIIYDVICVDDKSTNQPTTTYVVVVWSRTSGCTYRLNTYTAWTSRQTSDSQRMTLAISFANEESKWHIFHSMERHTIIRAHCYTYLSTASLCQTQIVWNTLHHRYHLVCNVEVTSDGSVVSDNELSFPMPSEFNKLCPALEIPLNVHSARNRYDGWACSKWRTLTVLHFESTHASCCRQI